MKQYRKRGLGVGKPLPVVGAIRLGKAPEPSPGGAQWVLPRAFQTGVGRAPSQHCGEGRIADLPSPKACPIFWGFHSRGSSPMEQSSLTLSRTFSSEGPPSLALQASHLAKGDLLEP